MATSWDRTRWRGLRPPELPAVDGPDPRPRGIPAVVTVAQVMIVLDAASSSPRDRRGVVHRRQRGRVAAAHEVVPAAESSPSKVVVARPARAQTGGGAGVAAGRRSGGSLQDHLHADVQNAQGLLAADNAGISRQEPVQRGPVGHDRLPTRTPPPGSRTAGGPAPCRRPSHPFMLTCIEARGRAR
jgi:hypothetical protein